MEYKNLQIEIKEIDETGTFTGLASPYNNIDDGNDKVLPSTGKRNNKKNVPMLWQHDTHIPIGSLLLIDTKEGIQANGKLALDKDTDGQYMVPKAAEGYALLKKGLLKLSIGYNTLEYEYSNENGKQIRNLKDIDIMEVSLVTFPMNEKAVVSNVKEKGADNLEEKAMSFADLLKVQQANDLRWKLQDALNASFRQLMDDDTMSADDKVKQLEANVDDFATAYKQAMSTLLKASSKNKVTKKQVMDELEKKAAEFETKAGKKISKANKTKLQQCKDMLDDLIATLEDEPDDSGEEGAEGDEKNKKPANKQKSESSDTLELKSDEFAVLEGINNYFKGDEK